METEQNKLTNHPAFTGIIPQNELVSRDPGKRYKYPAFLTRLRRASN